MKKVLLSILTVGMLFFVTGCGDTGETQIQLDEGNTKFNNFKISYDDIDVTPGVKFNYEDIKGKTPKISTIAGCALYGYDHVYTPCVGTVDLYKTSGHWDHYKENMFPSMKVDEEEFVLRPMNCPHHMLIYGNELHSYRDLPIRIGEFATDFRYEASGAVKGLERVRCMCQNDAHLFVRPEQIGEEFKKVVSLILDVYNDFGLKNYKFRLSLRDPEDKEKYFDDDDMWNTAENKLREVLNGLGVEYFEAVGEAAFYGPKLDVEVKPAVGPEVTLSTCQLDFLLPRRFELSYINSKGEKETPVVLHRAIFGTFDRFTAFILEETKGNLPVWLSPVQVNIIPVNNEYHLEYAEEIYKLLVASENFTIEGVVIEITKEV